MAKSIAEKHGLRATFMPKPFLELTGSGCHAHVSLWKDGKNLFEDEKGELGVSEMGYQFIGGIIHSADALCALVQSHGQFVQAHQRTTHHVRRDLGAEFGHLYRQ